MPDIEGVPYETTGTPLDQASAQALAARNREAISAGVAAGTDAKALAQSVVADVGTIRTAVVQSANSASAAAGSAVQAEQAATNLVPRMEHIETMAGLAPGEVTDAQTANLITQPSTATRNALNAATGQKIAADVPPLVAASIAADSTVAEAAAEAARDAVFDVGVVTWTPSRAAKNLYNPNDPDVQPGHTMSGFNVVASSSYTTTGYIPITPGQQYTMSNPRNWAQFRADKTGITGTPGADSTQSANTITAAADAAYLRASYITATYGATFQVEKGTEATAYEPYGDVGPRVLDLSPYQVTGLDLPDPTPPSVTTGPLTVARADSALTITADHNGTPLTINTDLAFRGNQVFNFTGTTLGGATVHVVDDDVAPLRTQHGTVGANHGYAYMAVYDATDHDKTTADLGSVWASSGRELVLLSIDSAGRAYFGGDYTVDSNGVDSMALLDNLTENLTHVSGATNTAPIDHTKQKARGAHQLWPSVARIRQAVFMDGNPLETGTAAGQVLEVRESYEVLHYGSLYDLAKANIGKHYTTLNVPGAVRVESVYKFVTGGMATVDVNLTEMRPTALAACGLVQAAALNGSATRYLPGVKAIGGHNWSTGVDLSGYSTSQLVRVEDLHTPTAPPVVSVDVMPNVSFVLGVHPWKAGVTSAPGRLKEAPTRLWDLRSTKKNYPNVIQSEPAGWGRYEGHAVRGYLTPAQSAQVTSAGADSFGAWAALETVAPLP